MFKRRIILVLLVGLIAAGAVRTTAETVVPASKQAELIAVLKSADASRKDKADACRLLTYIADGKAVPALAALLGDPEMNHMARYALEQIPDKAADDALLAALGQLEGRPLAGVIGSIGVRGDSRAVKALAGKLGDDAMIAQAAARSRGKIGDGAAAQALLGALDSAEGDTKLAICEGLLRCAEADGGASAVTIYNRLRKLDGPHQVRGGGLRGAILTSPDGMKLLKESLQSGDYILFSAAVQASREMKGTAVTQALVDRLGKGPADNQVLILGTLAIRGDSVASPAIAKAAAGGEKVVRIAAIEAMPPIGDPAAVAVLVKLMDDSDSDVAKAAEANLAAMEGKKVDQAVLAMLSSGDMKTQLRALDLIERRRIEDVAGTLLKAAKDDDEAVRAASIRMLGELGDDLDFDVLVKLLMDAGGAAEVRAAERALSQRCTKDSQVTADSIKIVKAVYGGANGPSADVTKKVTELVKSGNLEIAATNGNFGDPANGVVKQLTIEYTVNGVSHSETAAENKSITLAGGVTPPAYVEAMVKAQQKAPTAQKLALLRVLRGTGSGEGLDAVRSAMKSRDSEVRDEATSMLCDWPTVDALDDVKRLTTRGSDAKVKLLALRGTIRLIPLQSISDKQKLADFKKIVPLIERDQEKRLLLGVLPTVATAESLEMAMSYVGDAAIKNEACFSAVAIGDKIAGADKAQVTAAMRKVLQATTSDDVKKRARQVLNKAK